MWEYLSTCSKTADANVGLFTVFIFFSVYLSYKRQLLAEINYTIEQILLIIWFH